MEFFTYPTIYLCNALFYYLKKYNDICLVFFLNRNVKVMWHVLAYLQGQYTYIIDCHFMLCYFPTKGCNATTTIDVDICPRYNNISISSPLIDQKYIIFCGPGDTKKLYYRRIVREREKKWPCFMHVCIFRLVHSAVWQCHKFCESYCKYAVFCWVWLIAWEKLEALI